MTLVFSLGGSVIRENLGNLDELAEALDFEGQVIVVTGAGDLSKHLEVLEGNVNKFERDMVGIRATRLNASTLIPLIDAYQSVIESPDELIEAVSTGKNVVLGGLSPGYSTDAVASLAAEVADGDLYIATTVEGVYDPSPDHPEAELLESVKLSRLRRILGRDLEPGSYKLVDSTALDIIERSSIETKIMRGSFENISNPEQATGTELKTSST